MRRCGRTGRRQLCKLYSHLGPAAEAGGVVPQATITHSGEVITISENIDCTTSSVIYLLTCKKQGCGAQYIGETGRQL